MGKVLSNGGREFPRHYAAKNLNKVEKLLRKAIIKSANKHIRKKKITPHTKCYLTDEVKRTIKERNELGKTMGANRGEWIEACRKTKKMIATEKEKCWKEYVETLDRKSDAREVFRTIRAIDGQGQAQQHKNEVLEVDGISYIEDADKAEQFAKTYRKFSKLPSRQEDRAIKQKVRKARKQAKGCYILQESERDITAAEVRKVIKQAKNNKAAGQDDVPYEMLKHLGPKAMGMLVHNIPEMLEWRGYTECVEEGIDQAFAEAGQGCEDDRVIPSNIPNFMYGQDLREASGEQTDLCTRREKPAEFQPSRIPTSKEYHRPSMETGTRSI